jgi:transposase
MLQVTPQSRILAAVNPIDFRKGIDGLAGICLNQLLHDPLSGTIFLFRNRENTAIKILCYDGQGFWLCTKRLSKGKFMWWPTGAEATTKVDCRELLTLIWNGNPTKAKFSDDWRKVLI